jgi:hypothetical protein
LLARGRTAEAAGLIDPLTGGPPSRDDWGVHAWRAETDLLRGDLEAAARRHRQISVSLGHTGSITELREAAQWAVEMALWAGRPSEAIEAARRVLAPFTARGLTMLCGPLLTAGMRACADMAEQARARRDSGAARDAVATALELETWVGQMADAPFTDHPYVATIPASRASWEAERIRLAGASDPAAWSAAAKAWESLGCPHLAGYAWWRHAEAQLTAGQPAVAAATALQAAAAAAGGAGAAISDAETKIARRRSPRERSPTGSGPQV